jgi:hypothetical protein
MILGKNNQPFNRRLDSSDFLAFLAGSLRHASLSITAFACVHQMPRTAQHSQNFYQSLGVIP